MGIFIFEIDNDTGNIITYVTAKNMTKAVARAASVLDRAHNATNGIGEVDHSFPEISTKVGDKFEACALKVNDQSIQCTPGSKSPANRTETASYPYQMMELHLPKNIQVLAVAPPHHLRSTLLQRLLRDDM